MIDWQEQWALHAPTYKEGVCPIPLSNGDSFVLTPGPGFGDASHPTTQLMLSLLQKYAFSHFSRRNWSAFDIGCGSGILSLAAAKLGASSVYSIDIDKEALIHTEQNAKKNRVVLHLHKPLKQVDLIVMNMISSEQKNAWAEQKIPFSFLLTSGVLEEEESSYLAFAKQNGWDLIEKEKKAPWVAFAFKKQDRLF